jgi:hypothetical protein
MSSIVNPVDPFVPFERHRVRIQQDPAITALLVTGTSDTMTVFGTASVFNDTTGEYINYLSASGAGNGFGVRATAFTNIRGNNSPVWSTVMKTGAAAGDIQNMRVWCGICSANPVGADAPGAISLAAFRYAPATDGTLFWRAVTSDGASATTTTTAQSIAADTRYVLRIDWSVAARVDFYINDTLFASHTANLPAAATALGWVTEGSVTVSGTRNIRFRRTEFDQV